MARRSIRERPIAVNLHIFVYRQWHPPHWGVHQAPVLRIALRRWKIGSFEGFVEGVFTGPTNGFDVRLRLHSI